MGGKPTVVNGYYEKLPNKRWGTTTTLTEKGKRSKMARIMVGDNLPTMARRLGIPPSQLTEYETGRRPWDSPICYKIRNIYHITIIPDKDL